MEKLLTLHEVAEILKIHYQTVRTYIQEGQITAIKIGRNWRVKPEDLEEFVSKQARPTEQPVEEVK